jgi:hypothetical protein
MLREKEDDITGEWVKASLQGWKAATDQRGVGGVSVDRYWCKPRSATAE